MLHNLVRSEQIEDKVKFFGNIPDCYPYLPAFDSLVLSSLSESFGMVLLEAMIAGLPILASNRTGMPEVVGDVGQLFSAGNADELATGLQTIYQMNESERSQLKVRMYQRVVDHFSDESMRQQFWSLPFLPQFGIIK